jgi:elongation factor 1-beta
MGTAAIRFRLMPEDPKVDLVAVERQARGVISSKGGRVGAVEVKPFAFGLKSMEPVAMVPDKTTSPEALEEALSGIEGIQSVEVIEIGLL